MTTLMEAPAQQPSVDERIVFRGPVQRLLISPEIGALVGTVMVWLLFWATGERFGTAASTASWLDVAAPLGIMAVAVALLMIGGEFDLSAGVMTGSTGILVGLFAQKFLGDGVTMWLAVPVAFLAAGMIGWFNGMLVIRTGLPSFIVTLATFFILRGANLVFAKRLVNKVLVENINGETVTGFEVFRQIFASVHNKQTFGARDGIFLTLSLLGVAALAFAMMELSLVRRARGRTGAIGIGLVGLAAAAIGLFLAHTTDGVGGNLLAGIVGFGGGIVLIAGLASWRYETRAATGSWYAREATRPLLIGVGAVGVAIVATRFLDVTQTRVLLSVPAHGVKVAIGVAAFVIGVGVVARLGLTRLGQSVGGQRRSITTYPRIVLASLIGGLVLLVAVLTFLQLCTEQGFRAVLLIGLGAFGLLMLLVAKGRATRVSPRAQVTIGVITAAVIVIYGFVLRADSNAERFRAGLLTALLACAAVVLANTAVEYVCVKRSAADHASDRLGRLAGALGFALLFVAIAMRLFFTASNFRVSVLWWLLATAVGAFVLARTKWGNWIFAVGGNRDAARAIGVPADKVKVGLFVMTSLVGCFVGMLTALRFSSVAASQGIGEEFEYIIAAVVGGCLLTGGYGSVIGATLGAMIMAMTINGIPAARWNSDNRFIFLGAVLFAAVLVNQKIRQKAQEAR
jgi:ribose/xylose/arabinose/galactoside ABC-type transport system permease subunit